MFSSPQFQSSADYHCCLITWTHRKILHPDLGASAEDTRLKEPDLKVVEREPTDFCRKAKQNTKQVCNR